MKLLLLVVWDFVLLLLLLAFNAVEVVIGALDHVIIFLNMRTLILQLFSIKILHNFKVLP